MAADGAKGPGLALETLREGVIVALDAVRTNKVRSFLTILGVAVGVAVVVTMAALVTGIRETMFDAVESAGPNNFVVMRFDFTSVRLITSGGRPPWWDKPEITPAEAERIASLPAVEESLYNFGASLTADFEGRRVPDIQSQGYSSGWPAYTTGDFIAGRDFTPAEVRRSRPVAVLSAELALELFGQRDPIGRQVGVSSPFRDTREEFTVVGVFQPEENIFTAAVKHWIVFPYTAGFKRLKMSDAQAQILVVPRSDATLDEAQDQVTAALRSMRGLGPREENDFALVSSARILEVFNQLTGVFFVVMLGLSSAALMVGGVGVVGIMLISVTERTREIGIRKAVGATRREILWQFLVEAAVLTSLGGGVGLIIGAAVAGVVQAATPVPASIPLWSVAAALGMAAVTGMLFGLLPALRASRLEPVVALRAE
ncbi:MAG: ABC transporter permease [Gemmatimonadetes bacterium]|nr:ABC transporter permease [Gemmatimonadota bacterium]